MRLESLAPRVLAANPEMDRAALAEPWLLAHYLDRKYIPQAHHKLMSRELAAWSREPNARLMINTPPQVGKSTMAVVWTVFWRLCLDPSLKIMILTCAGDLAERHGVAVRNLVEEHGHRYGLALRRGSAKQTLWDTTQGGMVRAVGRGGLATGLPADECYVDDTMKDWVEALSKTTRDKVFNWLSAVVEARLGVGGRMCYVGTLWHRDDPAARLLAQDPAAWRVIRLAAIAGPGDPLGRAPGDPLPRPGADEHDRETLLRHWRLKERKTVPSVWEALYQCNPLRPGLQLITEEVMGGQIHRNPTATPLVRAVLVDPSVGEASVTDGSAESASQDTVGIVAGWLGDDQRVYLTHNATAVLAAGEWPDVVCKLAYDTQATIIYAEDNQGKGLIRVALAAAWQRLLGEGAVSGYMPQVELFHATKDKWSRAQYAATFWQRDLARMTDRLPEFIAEWVGYRPGDASPGAVDASGHLMVKLLPETPMGDAGTAHPAAATVALAQAAQAYPWRRLRGGTTLPRGVPARAGAVGIVGTVPVGLPPRAGVGPGVQPVLADGRTDTHQAGAPDRGRQQEWGPGHVHGGCGQSADGPGVETPCGCGTYQGLSGWHYGHDSSRGRAVTWTAWCRVGVNTGMSRRPGATRVVSVRRSHGCGGGVGPSARSRRPSRS